jgi:mannitol/fructose-specific phosphotransferase system IIA component (Ntr-type)
VGVLASQAGLCSMKSVIVIIIILKQQQQQQQQQQSLLCLTQFLGKKKTITNRVNEKMKST